MTKTLVSEIKLRQLAPLKQAEVEEPPTIENNTQLNLTQISSRYLLIAWNTRDRSPQEMLIFANTVMLYSTPPVLSRMRMASKSGSVNSATIATRLTSMTRKFLSPRN